MVGAGGVAEELLRWWRRTCPDVAIVDIRMPPTFTDEGLRAAARDPRAPPARGHRSSSPSTSSPARDGLLAEQPGGLGYLLKDRVGDVDELRDACGGWPRAARCSTRGGGPAARPPARDGPLATLSRARARGARAGRRGPLEQGDRRAARARAATASRSTSRRLRQARPGRGRGRQSPHPGRPRVPPARRSVARDPRASEPEHADVVVAAAVLLQRAVEVHRRLDPRHGSGAGAPGRGAPIHAQPGVAN